MRPIRRKKRPEGSSGASQVLAAQRGIQARLAALNRQSPVRERGRFGAANTPTAEFTESAQDLTAREMELASREVLVTRLKVLARARTKIREGTYGVCDACGGPIPPRRLEALPEATRCLPCAEAAEESHPRPGRGGRKISPRPSPILRRPASRP